VVLILLLKGRCCDIGSNIRAPTDERTDDVKGRFCEKLQCVFNTFPKYHTKVLLGDFNAKVGREEIFKPKIKNDSLHEITYDNGVRVANFATLKNLNET
jgi:hypothetical protein